MSEFSQMFQQEFMPVVAPGKLTKPRYAAAAVAATGPTGLARFALVQTQMPRNWAFYNLYRERKDVSHFLKGGKFDLGISLTVRPFNPMGLYQYPLLMPFPWFDLSPRSGSGAPAAAVIPNAPIQSNRPSGRTSTPKASSRAKRAPKFSGKCPPGHYWSWKKRKCVKSKF